MSGKAELSTLPMKEMLKPTGYVAPDSVADKTFAEATSGSGDGLKYHLYAWDYASGTAIAYSEKETPVAGDVVFLKEDMEGGKITNPTQLKLIYHVVSDVDGKITVSEHPEGSVGGYVFNRNAEDDYEESITDVRDMVDIASNGFLMSQKGTIFKGANVNVPSQASQGTNWINPLYPHYIDANTDEWQSPILASNFLIPLNRLQYTSQINPWAVLVDKTENKVIMASDDFGSNENLSDVDYTHEFEVRFLLDDKDTVDEIKRSRIDLLAWLTNCEPVPVPVRV